LPKKKELIKKARHITVISDILNFIHRYFVEINFSVDEIVGAISVDFNGIAQLLII
jgi:hypothetical protein